MIAEALIRHGEYPLLLDEPEHCGISIAVTVELLWKARAEIVALKSQLSENPRRFPRSPDTERQP